MIYQNNKSLVRVGETTHTTHDTENVVVDSIDIQGCGGPTVN